MSSELLACEHVAEPRKNVNLNDLITEVQRRSAVDLAFRNLALNDANAALAVVAQQPITDDLNIQFVDNSGTVKIVPLPDLAEGIVEAQGLEEAQLSDIKGYDISGWWSWGR
jgi:hypothetical protein